MGRCGSFFFLVLVVALVICLAGCLGSSTPNSGGGGVRSVSLSPGGYISINIGSTQVFTASAQNANGRPVAGVNIQYIVSSPPNSTSVPPLTITSGGNACAGTWDSSQALCSPGNSGIAIVTAIANGVSSPQTTVYVHQQIDSLQVSQAEPIGPTYDCFSQGQTWLYQGKAFSNGIDITDTVGQLSWSTTNANVITTNTNPPVTPPLPFNQVQITAGSPGVTQLFASVSGSTSNSIPITTCLVRYIRLQASGTTESAVTVNSGGTVALQATAVDTLGNTLAKPPLTWITSNPEVVSFGSITNSTGSNSATARSNLGGADISAACVPPTCNIGVETGYPFSSSMPVYVFANDGLASPLDPLQAYGTISVDVTTTTTVPTYTAWVATNGCGPSGDTTNGCTSVMFAATPTTTSGKNPIGATATLPRTPNSMIFNHQSRIYLGSDQGLMYYDVGGSGGATLLSASSTPCNVALCGIVLAVSNDGKQVVVSDGTVPAVPQVYIYNTGNSTNPVTDLVLPPNAIASAATFSPDLSKIFILTNSGTMYVYSTVNALGSVPVPSSQTFGTGVAFSPDGSFAYVAGAAESVGTAGNSGSLSTFSTCATSSAPSELLNPGSPLTVSTPAAPLQIFPSPTVQHISGNPEVISQNIFVFDPPYIHLLNAQFAQNPLPQTEPGSPPSPPPPSQYFCNVPTLTSFGTVASYTPAGQFTPVYANLVNNGAEMIIVARLIPSVLIFNIANGDVIPVPIPGTFDPLAASASTDGSQVFVAACDQYPNNDPSQPCSSGAVYALNINTGFVQRIPYINNTTNNMCSGQGAGAPQCFPTMVAIKPQ